VVILAASGAAGNYLTRAVAPTVHASPSAAPSASGTQDVNADGSVPGGSDGVTVDPQASGDPGNLPRRPPDALAAWARRISPAVGVSVTALQAYGLATLRAAADHPTCHLGWTTLAAIGKVESDHGKAKGATLQPDGTVLPPIIGAALDGKDGRQTVLDTDAGKYDGDRTYDHAVGPMQFIPHTWEQYQVDADQDGQADPNNINDSALAAANYLCAGGKDLATSGGWWGAILSYNDLRTYAQSVFDAADDYGQRSRTVA